MGHRTGREGPQAVSLQVLLTSDTCACEAVSQVNDADRAHNSHSRLGAQPRGPGKCSVSGRKAVGAEARETPSLCGHTCLNRV